MFHATLDAVDVQDFRGRMHGELICMGDEALTLRPVTMKKLSLRPLEKRYA